MKSQDIQDVLTVREILSNSGEVAKVIAALIDWKNGSTPTVQATPEPVAAQRETFLAEDGANDTRPTKPPLAGKATAASAKAKGRAKPPPPADDDVTTSSDDDADF